MLDGVGVGVGVGEGVSEADSFFIVKLITFSVGSVPLTARIVSLCEPLDSEELGQPAQFPAVSTRQ